MTLTINLKPKVEAKLKAEAARLGRAEEEIVEELIDRSLPTTDEADDAQFLLKAMDEIRSRISPEELREVPTDLARNVDHYLYGHPKQS
jgi:hypothetical protein